VSPARKRITKKQLKDDKFVDVMLHYGDLLRRHQRALLLGVLGLIAVVLIGTWSVNYFRTNRSGSHELFSTALASLSRAMDAESDGDFEGAMAQFQNLRDEYPRRPEGRWALYYLAFCQAKMLDYLTAERTYEEYLQEDPDGEYEIPARLGIASCNGAVGRTKRQADFLRELARSGKVDENLSIQWLYRASQIYLDSGYFEPAQETLEELEPMADASLKRRVEQDLRALKARQS